MRKDTSETRKVSIGLDLGDRFSYLVGVQRNGTIEFEERLATTEDSLERAFSEVPKGTRVICEAGTHSPWVSALLKRQGLEVVVANPCQAGRVLAANGRKNDKLDAITLATLGFDSLRLLRPIQHRGAEAQNDLAVLRARSVAVRMRTSAINSVRGLVKTSGHRLPSCSSRSFHRQVLEAVPDELRPALVPLIEHIGEMTALIRSYDQQIEALGEKYEAVRLLRTVPSIGPITALAFVLTIDDPKRFRQSRDVGAFLGLVPGQHESGDRSPQLRITKAGNRYLRDLLVGCAHYLLARHKDDCDLKRFGERIASRGGRNGKKRAVTAIARKLAVVMHRIWMTGESYDPFYRSSKRQLRHTA